ncbi:hypothetical protein HY439_03230 [Candidatus Microgenomates bacterium]|nr:hypothetical protein [Candidatus Microgenomates bacterium]
MTNESAPLKNINPWMIVAFFLLATLAANFLFQIDLKISPRIQSLKKSGSAAPSASNTNGAGNVDITQLEKIVLPERGVELPVVWGDFGKKLIDAGVIDQTKFEQIFTQGGRTLSDDDRKLISGSGNGKLKMTKQNSQVILDLLWAFGLANKNDVLEKGEMMRDPKQVGNFASTGGWTLAKGKATDYYSSLPLVTLKPEQQALVEKVSQGVYRPCCGNSTHFPDCNHGMAMLGLLELMAAQGATEQEMFKNALAVNSYWFPQTYVELAAYFAERGTTWDKVNPQEVLGFNYSSAKGYNQIRPQIKSLPPVQQGGGSCGA